VIQARFDYDPYGRRTQTYGTLWVDYGFAGLMHHKASGICFAVWRIYQPDVARWASRDPIREEGGLNLYADCENDPGNSIDLLGLWSWAKVRQIIEHSKGGTEIFAQIRKYGATIYRTGTIEGNGKQWPAMTVAGNEVWLNVALSDLEAAADLIHELRHVKQNAERPNMKAPCREYDAYAFQEEWLITNGYDALIVDKEKGYKPFRNSDNTLNFGNLIRNVDIMYNFNNPAMADSTMSVHNVYTYGPLKKRVF
jgi:RHS repeat-associated protein